MHGYLFAIWELIWHTGIWAVPIAIGLVGAWFIPPFRKLFILLAILGVVGFFSFIAGVADEKRMWKAAEDRTLAAEAKARDDAVLTIDKYPLPGVRYDRYDRDGAPDGMLSVARDHILGQKRHPKHGKASTSSQPSRP